MKLTVSFKTPDAVDYTIDDMERAEFDSDEAFEEAKDKARALMDKYIEYGEYVLIDFDTEAGTATVRKVDG